MVEARKAVTLAGIIFFIVSFLSAFFIITILPYSYFKQKHYSFPSNEGNSNSFTMGGEALTLTEDPPPVPVFLRPRPGATNISLNTVISIFQTRPVPIDLQLSPNISMTKKDEEAGWPSITTKYYPAELLQPSTTYNVSGSIGGESAWWTFTTASTFLQPEYILTPYAWGIIIIAASIATSLGTFVFFKKRG